MASRRWRAMREREVKARVAPSSAEHKRHWTQRPWARTAELAAVLVATGGVLLAAVQYLEEREDRKAEAIARAWMLLTTPASGNSGKRSAIEFLVREGVPLDGVDLSCAKMGGGWSPPEEVDDFRPDLIQNGADYIAPSRLAPFCKRSTFLRSVDLRGASLRDAKFDGADLTNAQLSGADLRGASFIGATMTGATLEDVKIIRASFAYANLDDSTITTQLTTQNLKFNLASMKRTILTFPISESNSSTVEWGGADLTGAKILGNISPQMRGLPIWMIDLPFTREEEPIGSEWPFKICLYDDLSASNLDGLLGAIIHIDPEYFGRLLSDDYIYECTRCSSKNGDLSCELDELTMLHDGSLQ